MTNPKCKTCNGAQLIYIVQPPDISKYKIGDSVVVTSTQIDCPDCTKCDDSFLGLCYCDKLIIAPHHINDCEKSLSPAEQCKAKIDAALVEFGATLVALTWPAKEEDIVELYLEIGEEELTLSKGTDEDPYVSYNGKTEVNT